ncbi:unnamed protein product [Urochloa humidicola]
MDAKMQQQSSSSSLPAAAISEVLDDDDLLGKFLIHFFRPSRSRVGDKGEPQTLAASPSHPPSPAAPPPERAARSPCGSQGRRRRGLLLGPRRI